VFDQVEALAVCVLSVRERKWCSIERESFQFGKVAAMKLEELHEHHAEANVILLSLLGIVFDVSSGREEFFGPTGPYRVFSGHDASYALSIMSLNPKDVDVFEYDLEAEDAQTLADWIKYFDHRYHRFGVLDDVSHPFTEDSLPEGKLPGIATKYSAENPASSEDDASNAQAMTLSQLLIRMTNSEHTKALHAPLMQQIMDRTIDKQTYGRFVCQLYYIYQELESQLGRRSGEPIIRSVDHEGDLRLRRLPSIQRDIQYFYGIHFFKPQTPPLLSTIRYVSRITEVAPRPHLLLVHHWMRYGAGLAGGQFLRSALSASLNEDSQGIEYHIFRDIEDINEFYQQYLARIDKVKVSLDQVKEMIEEARIAFNLNIEVMNEVVLESEAAKL